MDILKLVLIIGSILHLLYSYAIIILTLFKVGLRESFFLIKKALFGSPAWPGVVEKFLLRTNYPSPEGFGLSLPTSIRSGKNFTLTPSFRVISITKNGLERVRLQKTSFIQN